MAATPILTQGTTFTIDDSGGTPVTINGVMSLSGLGSGSATEIEVTTLASTAKEFRQGLQDFGSFSLELIRDDDDAGQAELLDAMTNQATRDFIVTLPSGTLNVLTFSCIVLSVSHEIGADGVQTGTANIRVTGPITRS